MPIIDTVEFQMSLLLFFGLIGYLIAMFTKQSAVVGQILAGIMIGPSLLNLITYTELVSNLAHLGAIVLLFVIGLEFKMKDLLQIRSFNIALLGVIIPWLGGFLCARLFQFDHKSAIFIGTALTATSIAITANVLYEMGQLKADFAKAIIGAAVIDDILALAVLSVTTQVLSGQVDVAHLLMITGKTVAFLVLSIAIGHLFLSRLLLYIDKTHLAGKFPDFLFVLTMLVAFGYALIAESLEVSAIIGAFIAGVSLEGVGITSSKNFRDGAEYLRVIFATIFFISLGVIADFSQVNTQILWFILILTLVAILSKLFGCGLAAKAHKMSWTKAAIIGVGMSPRGEVAMIIALLGLNANIITQNIYVSIVSMSLITTIVAPLLIRPMLSRLQTNAEI